MGFLANLLVKIGVDTRDLNAGMDKATRSVNKFGQDIENVGRRMAVGITLPIAGLAAVALKASADMESLRMGLTAITHSSSETEKQIARLKEVAKIPGLDFQGAVKGSINLQAAGFSATMAERALKSFGNALATVGKGKEDLEGVNLVLTQILNKPKVMAQDLNQLRERLPQISQAMKAAFGSNVSEDIQALGVTGEQFVAKIIAEFEKLPPVTSGLKNSFENLRDNAFQALAKMGDGLAPIAQRVINDVLTPMATKVKELAEEFGKLPKPVQNTILGVGVAAAAFPLLTIAIGATITNAIAIGSAFVKMGPLIGKGAAALELWVAGMGRASISWGAMVATGMLRVSIYAAAAVAVVQLANAWWEYSKAKEAAAQAEKTQQQKLLELEISLKRQGADISAVQKQYSQGEISLTQYLQRLRDVAIELGKGKLAHEGHGDAAKKSAEALSEVKEKLSGIPFGTKGLEAAVLVEQIRNLVAEQHRFVSEVAKAGGVEEYHAQALGHVADAMKMLEESPAAEGISAMSDAAREFVGAALPIHPTVQRINEALKQLGVEGKALHMDALRADFDVLGDAMEKGIVTTDTYIRSWINLVKAMDAAGEAISPEARRELIELEKTYGGQIKETRREVNAFEREMQRTYHAVTRGIASSIVNFKGWGETFKSIAKDTAQGILTIFIEGFFKRMAKELADLLANSKGVLGSIGKWLGGLAGGGGGGGGKSPAPPSVPGGGGGSAASGAASGVGGIANIITGAITAVSSVVSNFQQAKAEKTLNAIEESTRYLSIYTGGQNDSVLATLHIVRDKITDLAASMRGAVKINLDGKITSEEANSIMDRLVNGSFGFYEDTYGIFVKMLNALEGGFAVLTGQVRHLADAIKGPLNGWAKYIPMLSASNIGGAIGGLGSSAASAAMGPIGAIANLASGLLGGDGKVLGLIEVNTRSAFNEIANFRADAWTREGHWYARTSDMWQSILDIKDVLGRTEAAGRGGLTIVINGGVNGSPNEIASAIFTQAQLAGAI